MKKIDLEGINHNWYSLTEDGRVYSHIKNKYLTAQSNSSGYLMYFLQGTEKSTSKWHMAHRLVAMFYTQKPDNKYKVEVHHIDHNKHNNHYSNLEWVTRSENILRSYRETDRVCYWKDKKRGELSTQTKIKMSNAKKKSFEVYLNGTEYLQTFDSIDELCEFFDISRKTFYLIRKGRGSKKFSEIKFVEVYDTIS